MTSSARPLTDRPGSVSDQLPRPESWLPVLVAVVACCVLRLPTLADPHYYTDEGIFAAVAQRLLQGHALYAGAWDDKPPLVFWLYALLMAGFGPSVLALRVAATVAAALTAAAAALLGVRLAGQRAGIAAGLLCAILTATPFQEGNLALTEIFGAAPAAGAVALVLLNHGHIRRRDALGGALLAAAFLFKQVFALDALAVGLLFLAGGRQERNRLPAIAAGFLLICLVAAAVLALQGGLGEGLYAVFGFYVLYLGDGAGAHGERWLVVALALAVAMAALRRPPAVQPSVLAVTLWLLMAQVGVLVGGRPYGHYLLQMAAPLAVATVVLGVAVLRGRPRPLLLLCGAILAATTVTIWSFRDFYLRDRTVTVEYYANVAALVSGQRDAGAFRTWYTWRVAAQEQLAATIKQDRERTLFVWGEYPWLYPLTEAENPTRYPTSFHLSFVPGSREEALAALRRRPPRFIVHEGDEWRRLPGLDDLLAERYELIATIAESKLYRRR